MRRVVVVNCMCVEQLARVVCVVSGILEPDGEVVVVEVFLDELGVATRQSESRIRWKKTAIPKGG